MKHLSYVGNELELFAEATNWKKYLARRIQPYLGKTVLEVGAGNGVNTERLSSSLHDILAWTALEPDRNLANLIRERNIKLANGSDVGVVEGTIDSVPKDPAFDSILYIDVLEHIEHDHEEIKKAVNRLAPRGTLIILCPAHSYLFSEFDKALGHFRRYDDVSLSSVIPSEMKCIELKYLDSVGMLASLANKIFLKQSVPTEKQIYLWDKVFVRTSYLLDPLLCYSLGKSILGIWRKE